MHPSIHLHILMMVYRYIWSLDTYIPIESRMYPYSIPHNTYNISTHPSAYPSTDHTDTYIHIPICISRNIHYIHIALPPCMYPYMYAVMYPYIHSCVILQMHTSIFVYTHLCIHMLAYRCICPYILSCMHTTLYRCICPYLCVFSLSLYIYIYIVLFIYIYI